MGIPFTGANIHMIDEESGVDYEMVQSTDETEIALEEFEEGFERDVKKRLALFETDKRAWRRWLNGHIDILLRGWSHPSSKLPAFPKNKPSAHLDGETKVKILNWWRRQKNLSKDEIKK